MHGWHEPRSVEYRSWILGGRAPFGYAADNSAALALSDFTTAHLLAAAGLAEAAWAFGVMVSWMGLAIIAAIAVFACILRYWGIRATVVSGDVPTWLRYQRNDDTGGSSAAARKASDYVSAYRRDQHSNGAHGQQREATSLRNRGHIRHAKTDVGVRCVRL